MRRELGIGRCGLACCLCSENARCSGCGSDGCADKERCENRKCSLARNLSHCYECGFAGSCKKGMLGRMRPRAFTEFARRYGAECLLDCLERNEANGAVYHRRGLSGDYDDFDDAEKLIGFIKTGPR